MAQVTKVSPLAPAGGFPTLPSIRGVRFAACAAGVKYQGRDDVMIAVADDGAVIAGTFTKSATRAAPVLDCEEKLRNLQGPGPLAILVNSGNSNAFTGNNGRQSVDRLAASVSQETGVPLARVFTASTGVIGELLPDEKISSALSSMTATP